MITASDYMPLDLSGVFNNGSGVFEASETMRFGERVLHGLPFSFGPPIGDRSVLVLDGASEVTLPLPPGTRWVIVAHAVLEESFLESGAVGDTLASYDFLHSDGTKSSQLIRQRYEIGPTPRDRPEAPIPLDWGQTPFLAVPETEQVLMHRTSGRYDEAGARLVEIEDPQSRIPYVLPYRYFLFAWPVPDGAPAIGLRLSSRGARIVVGAITAGFLLEDPLGRTVAEDVIVDLDREVTERLSIYIDRGSATYLHPAQLTKTSHVPGWGAPNLPVRRGWARLSGAPSATVRILDGDNEIAACRFGALREAGEARDRAAHFRIVNRDRTWLSIHVADAVTGARRPCRLHMRTSDGVPVAPYGHHAPVGGGGATWNLDIGGDVRLGARDFAVIDGSCEGWVPVGELIVEAACGFDYCPLSVTVQITEGQRNLDLVLQPLGPFGSAPTVAGDTHLHFMSSQGVLHEAQAEGVAVANLLLSQWGQHFSSTEEFTGHPLKSVDGRTVVFAGQENRSNILGHIHLLGMERPIRPWCTGGAEEAALGGGIETTLSHWADECHEVGGTVVAAHFPVPDGEIAALVATGRLDAVEMIACEPRYLQDWYNYLNAGYRLPLVGGTDKMTAEVAVGQMRTYAEGDPDTADYQSWLAAIRHGHCMASSGPRLDLSVEGARPGDILDFLPGRRLRISAEARSIFPLELLELLVNGEVVATERARGAEMMRLDFVGTVEDCSWVAARTYAGPEMCRHFDVWQRPIMAHTSPVYLSRSGQYARTDYAVLRHMQALCEGARLHLLHRATTRWPGAAVHRHGQTDHVAHMVGPIDDALSRIAARLSGGPGSAQHRQTSL